MIRTPALPTSRPPPLLIVGAAVRAAAGSARRAGFEPWCCDQFGDADLRAISPVVRTVQQFPEFLSHAAELPDCPVLYTGGLENHPEIISALAETRQVLGNDAATLQAIRDPVAVTETLAASRMPHLEVRDAQHPPPADGTWLLKPRHSAGGKGIVVWTAEQAASPTLSRPHYFQKRAEGSSYSAVFLGHANSGDVRFVGLTEQLVGAPECHAPEFAWCGNIGPAALPVDVENVIRRLGNFLKWKFNLRGLFGLDLIVRPDGSVAATEINPRYPASLELLEFATGTPLLLDHCACFGDLPEELSLPRWQPKPGLVLGRAVVYSPKKAAVKFRFQLSGDAYQRWPRYADVPAAGAVVRAGEPVCSVYAAADTTSACREKLWASARSLLRPD